MSKAIAFLSGKGGSGKTTLALTMASLLSDCGVKVLLVDSDLATNGATYFYMDHLPERGSPDLKTKGSFHALTETAAEPSDQYAPEDPEYYLHLNSHCDFLPSILRITKKTAEPYRYTEESAAGLARFVECVRERYDVVLFDCQAGYTDLLKALLPLMDYTLVVLEPDAISTYAVRSLHLKIGDLIEQEKAGQVYSKATEEERNTYESLTEKTLLSYGMIFHYVDTLVFDWKIRKEVSVAKLPDIWWESAAYGGQVRHVCQVLFQGEAFRRRLAAYDKKVKELSETEIRLHDKGGGVNSAKKRRAPLVAGVLSFALMVIGMITFISAVVMSERGILSLDGIAFGVGVTLAIFMGLAGAVGLLGSIMDEYLTFHKIKKAMNAIPNLTKRRDVLRSTPAWKL